MTDNNDLQRIQLALDAQVLLSSMSNKYTTSMALHELTDDELSTLHALVVTLKTQYIAIERDIHRDVQTKLMYQETRDFYNSGRAGQLMSQQMDDEISGASLL